MNQSVSTRPGVDRAGAILVIGFGVAVAVWVAAFVTHLPWLDLPAQVSGPVVLGVWLTAAMIGARLLGRDRSKWLTSAAAGSLTAVLTLLIFNSLLVEQPAMDQAPKPGTQGLRDNAPLLMAGFVMFGVVLGLVGCAIAGRFPTHPSDQPANAHDWHARLATVAAVSVVPLLIVGGKVTSAKAGMAIIGWPGSDGANMFLYPIALMANPERFLEHTHRLFGALVGLTFMALLIFSFFASRRPIIWLYAAGLFVGVAIQGYIGGRRVNDNSPALAAVHGVAAQLFFAAAVAFAARLRSVFERGSELAPPSTGRTLRTLTAILFGCLLVQLVFGAMYRHLGHLHALWSHVGFSFIVLALCVVTGAKIKRAGQSAAPGSRATLTGKTLSRVGSGLTHVVGLQFVLGWIALWASMSLKDRTVPIGSQVLESESVPVLTMLARSIHQANGALLIAMTSLALVWVFWLFRPTPGSSQATN